jgi:hypothetical protein
MCDIIVLNIQIETITIPIPLAEGGDARASPLAPASRASNVATSKKVSGENLINAISAKATATKESTQNWKEQLSVKMDRARVERRLVQLFSLHSISYACTTYDYAKHHFGHNIWIGREHSWLGG